MSELAYLKIAEPGGMTGRAAVPLRMLEQYMSDGWSVITREEYLGLDEKKPLAEALGEIRPGGGYFFISADGQMFDMTDEVNAAFSALADLSGATGEQGGGC